MALIFDPNNDDEQKKQQQAMQGSVAPGAQAGTPSASSASPAKPQGSGNFTNLQSYIRANADTDAGKQVGAGVMGSPDKAVGEANAKVGALDALTPGAGPAAMEKDEEDWLGSRKAPTSITPASAPMPGTGPFAEIVADSRIANATTQSQTATQDSDRFAKLFEKYGKGAGTYQGVSKDDVANQQAGALSSLTSASQAAANLRGDNQAGRAGLLKTQYGADKQYSAGENKLDSFLLEKNYGDKFEPKYQQTNAAIQGQTQKANDTAAAKIKTIGDTQDAFGTTNTRWRDLLNGAKTAVSSQKEQADAEMAAAMAQKAALTPAPAPTEIGPITSTDTVSSGAAGDKIGTEQVTTMYPDGSYDVRGAQGEIIQYNADGTIKSTSGTNIFT